LAVHEDGAMKPTNARIGAARIASALALLATAAAATIASPTHASATPASIGRILHVDASASGPGDGATWPTAFTDLNAALAAASTGDQVWVAAGTYTPAASDRTATFALANGVALFGGFAGDEAALDQRDWIHHRTILSGDLAGDDGPDFANTGENSYHVVTARNVDRTAVLSGFTITGGRADGPGLGPVSESADQGSALHVFSATPRIDHVLFVRNWSIGHGAVNDNGGAELVQCEFRENFASDFAAALYVGVGAATRVIDCAFAENETNGQGAGIYCLSTGGAEFTGCTFYGNSANVGGGMFNAADSRALVRACSFRGNNAFIGGGGVYDDGASPRVIGCTFENNAGGIGVQDGSGGVGGSGGGGLWNSGGQAVVQSCVFRNNAASFGGGAYNNNQSTGVFRDCTFEHNFAHEAGGLYNLGSDVLVQHCSFVQNTAYDGDFSVGGGISNYYSNPLIENCSFRANHAEVGGGGLYNEGAAPTVLGCVFAENTTDGAKQGWGGGIFNGYFTEPVVCNCTFTGNVAHRGAGIFDIIYARPTILCSTFSGNVSAEGGCLHDFEGSETRLVNCILWGNAPEEMSGVLIRADACCVRGGYPGFGNLDADPLFVLAPAPGLDGVWGTGDDQCGDLRLRAGSPCIDAGDNSAVPAGLFHDLAGNPRFVDDPDTLDTGTGRAPIVDLGAFEF
jgi:hypothetical protein